MKVQGKVGKVVRKRFAEGSKSEHDAVMLVTGDKEYKLRRQGGNPFFDPELEALVGRTISCQGLEHDYTFIMSECEELLDEASAEGSEDVLEDRPKASPATSDDGSRSGSE